MSRIYSVLFLLLLLGCAASRASLKRSVASDDLLMASVVRDLCDKRVALLGEEASHGNGKTIQFKAELAKRLITECHYDAFFVESGTYDFLKFNELLSSGSPVDEQKLDAAIGPLWATTQEMQPLISFLFEQAKNGTVLLGGIDDQIGAGTYAQRDMTDELTAYLGEKRRGQCRETIGRYTAWTYDDSHPYNARAAEDILRCWQDIGASLSKLDDEGNSLISIYRQMIRSLVRDFTRERAQISGASPDADNNDRDRSMYLNFQWLMAQSPRPKKVIIWTATVHAAKQLKAAGGSLKGRTPFGAYLHQEYQDEASVVACSALTGSFARYKNPPKEIPAAPVDSLEYRAFQDESTQTRYFTRTELRKLGTTVARPLNYSFASAANWSLVLDGYLIFREENPPHFSSP